MASAPLTGRHVNCSPKGLPGATFTIFDATHCAYIDATGSGSETIAHCYENGRVTVMFCSFDTLPRILRFFCTGTVIEKDDPRFESTIRRMGKEPGPGQRAVIMLHVWRVITSCGTGVPLISAPQGTDGVAEADDDDEVEVEGASGDGEKGAAKKALGVFRDRADMPRWLSMMEQKSKLEPYQTTNNAESLDGVPAMKWARRQQGQWLLLHDLRYAVSRSLAESRGLIAGLVLGVVLMLVLRVLRLDAPLDRLAVIL